MRSGYFQSCTKLVVLVLACAVPALAHAGSPTAELAREVADKGWIIYSARADNGTWDLFRTRPDGSIIRRVTQTFDYEEAAPRYSPDGARILYRRFPKGSVIDHDEWGFGGTVVIANADGSDPREFGGEEEYPWANWMPDGEHISCLYREGIRIIHLETGEVVKEMPRQGIFQQLFPSPDGQWFCGTGNVGQQAWNIVCINANTGEATPVHVFQSCTPDWFPDSQHVIYSSRPPDQKAHAGYGATQLWMARADGSERKLVYGDDAYHVYGGLVSPDAAYVLFTKSIKDGGGSEKEGAPMFLMRLADAPAVGGTSAELRQKHPDVKDAPVVSLFPAWEPDWTYAEVAGE